MTLVFKICAATEWAAAEAAGVFKGSVIDHADGFIHLSSAAQVRETAARHFARVDGLVLVAFAAEELAGLKWDASRGGAMFPHVYGHLPVRLARWVKPLPVASGARVFPQEVAF